MHSDPTTRREVMKLGSAAIAALLLDGLSPGFVYPGQEDAEKLVPFLDMPPARPGQLDWEALSEWITPQKQVFSVQHYGVPEVDADAFQLEISGLVERPMTLTLDEIKGLPRQDQLMTLECSGNGASKTFLGAIYNGKWTGAALAPLLKQCGIKPEAKEIVFIGADESDEVLRKGTRRELSIRVPFGRSMSIEDAMNIPLLLAYERNGKPLENRNGGPLRLIVPGWYAVASVKWLTRIEVRDTRYMGRFMARDYVTVRGERRGDEVEFVETSVTKMNLKSIIARVTRRESQAGKFPLKAYGAVWSDGTQIKGVEVQIDGGEWMPAKLDDAPRAEYSWTFFSIDLGAVAPGKHTVVSRAIDANGRVQPSAEDDEIALKKTYWEAYQQWPREIEVPA